MNAPASIISCAHPDFGSIIASSSFDRTVKIWESSTNGSQNQQSGFLTSRWAEIVVPDAKGTLRAVEFALYHFGLKLASIAIENMLPDRRTGCAKHRRWTSPGYLSLATPAQTHATLAGASASLVSQVLQQGLQQSITAPTLSRAGPANREADGGWCISWCKDKYWGEVIAAGCGINRVVKIIQLDARQPPYSPSPPPRTSRAVGMGMCAYGKAKWTAVSVADFDQHKSADRVEWNITGTILSSLGNDGRARLSLRERDNSAARRIHAKFNAPS